ncbi:hypothetical protein POSPLADRAFT_1045011 [Postia placenta MAD-698-R-SB12]|uniref:F-box domain-containing protein n=1 Tax=Postia placenta MAD-698-R-SB12 TaxID=670580 RepID=A0A1X6N5S3_9APHY|nr:hypothetical protein POSPLADRAFT_1045011 [Postia placenta MAD-698-R-SB12]OSX63822.1 hypothetical protein POSPLADRAFT_1045011 [Postia placenta MAD-698-R-SB12]
MSAMDVNEQSESPLQTKAPFLSLNDDVLSLILSDLSTHDALQLSATARDVHFIAKQRALQEVKMTTNASAARICTYLLGDIPNRLHLVRDLTVRLDFTTYVNPDGKPFYSESAITAAHLFASVLGDAIYLRSLHLTSVGILLQVQPRIGPALSALTNLRLLDLQLIGSTDGFTVLREIRCRPEELKLSVGTARTAGMHTVDVNEVLSCLQDMQTIKRLTLSHINEQRFDDRLVLKFSDPPSSWSTVHDLSLLRCRMPMRLAVLAFPNLRVLRVNQPISCPPPKPDSEQTVCWSNLDFVEGPIELLYEWPFTCPIHHLSLQSVLAMPYHGSTWGRPPPGADLAATLNLVKRASPRVLELSIMAYPALGPAFWAELARQAPGLRSLAVKLCSFSDDEEFLTRTFMDFMETLSAALGSISTLVHVRLCILSSLLPDDPTHVLPEKLTSTFIKALPSLCYVSLSMKRHQDLTESPWEGQDSWRIISSDKERKLESIESKLEERMRERIVALEFNPAVDLDESRI